MLVFVSPVRAVSRIRLELVSAPAVQRYIIEMVGGSAVPVAVSVVAFVAWLFQGPFLLVFLVAVSEAHSVNVSVAVSRLFRGCYRSPFRSFFSQLFLRLYPWLFLWLFPWLLS